jgi:DNA-binding MurR/RpiR family transcriptional regulator
MTNRLMGTLFSQLEDRLPGLPRKQAILAHTILETPELVAFGSVRDISSQLDMNNSTVIRFAKSLGFSGYQELQSVVREAYLARAGLKNSRRDIDNDGIDQAANTFAQQLANLEIARQHFSDADTDRICKFILEADRIIVIATGSATIPGLMLIRLLRHIGLRGELASGSLTDQLIAIHDIGPNDTVIAIGLWLTFNDTFRALDVARRKQARTLAITGSATSSLGKAADIEIYAPAQGSTLTFSVVATLAIVEAMIANVAAHVPESQQLIEQELHNFYVDENLLAPAFPRAN